jgi:alkylated DNA repair dioxygenase AlkB
MMSAQPDLFAAQRPAPTLPEGLVYRPELISAAQETDLVARLETLDLRPFEFQGYLGLRRVIYFGWRYDFTHQKVGAAEPIPDFLLPLREAAAGLAGLPAEALAQVLVNEYRPGAPIGWHRDRPQFGDVVGVSLLSPARMRFRRKRGADWERAALRLEPRSAYVLRGPAREEWEHSIPPAQSLRYSVTFRTLRERLG